VHKQPVHTAPYDCPHSVKVAPKHLKQALELTLNFNPVSLYLKLLILRGSLDPAGDSRVGVCHACLWQPVVHYSLAVVKHQDSKSSVEGSK
jgi:hypothetical protein